MVKEIIRVDNEYGRGNGDGDLDWYFLIINHIYRVEEVV